MSLTLRNVKGTALTHQEMDDNLTYLESEAQLQENSDYTMYSPVVVSSNHTASAGEVIAVDTSGSAITVTLPGSPSQGDFVGFEDYSSSWSTNNLTVDGNGNDVIDASTFTADVDNWSFGLRFNGTKWIFAYNPM